MRPASRCAASSNSGARRHGRALPTRRDLNVLDMGPWLGRVSLFEVPENDEIRCRLYGSLHPTSPSDGLIDVSPVAAAVSAKNFF
jgi:hypothetical protein